MGLGTPSVRAAAGTLTRPRRKRISGLWPKIAAALIFGGYIIVIVIARASPEFNGQNLFDWKSSFEFALSVHDEKGSGLRNYHLARAARIAARSNDWRGMVLAACATKRSANEDSLAPLSPVRGILLDALIAAERTKSRAGVKAVARAFESLGSPSAAAMSRSRVRPDWPRDQEAQTALAFTGRCGKTE